MSDKIRGAVFNMLGDIDGLSVLDAFAGSGALSLEAASRGAEQVIAIDVDKNAHNTIQANIKSLRLGGTIKAIRANASGWSDNNPDARFDIVICDPPYDHIQQPLLQKLANHAKSGGIIIYSLPPSTDFSLQSDGFEHLAAKNYGDAQLVFYRKV